jgi:hypothetical protein
MQNQEFKIEIPEKFYSDADGKPFENCQICGKYLLNEGTSYVVEKAFKNYKGYDFSTTLFEYAICTHCHTKVQKSMSEESMRNLQQYYMRKIREKGNQPIVINLNDFKLDDWISKCFFSDEPVIAMDEYQLVAQFNGSKMVMNMPPMVVGEAAMEEMAGLLSNETIDEMNGFKKQFLGPDPELEEIISGKKLILI